MDRYRVGYLDEDRGAQIAVRRAVRSDFDVHLFDITSDFTPDSVVCTIRSECLDLVIIDFILTDTSIISFNGDNVVNAINKWNPFFPLLVLTSHQFDAIHSIENANLIYEKDIVGGDPQSMMGLKRSHN
jgi:hypothetical protein